MSDIRKSKILRGFLWLLAMAVIVMVVGIVDALIDRLPIWSLSKGENHNMIECSLFLVIAGTTVWRWLSRRVWIAALPPDRSHP